MKVVISAIIAAFAFIAVPAMAAGDKLDCKGKDKEKAECKKH